MHFNFKGCSAYETQLFKKELLLNGGHSSKVLLRGTGWVWIKCYALAELEETVGEGKNYMSIQV